MYEILLTCPPMIGMASRFEKDFCEANFNVTVPEFTQEMTEDALCEIIGSFDGWIIGDDPATRKVLEAGVNGKLKACMRWGVGTNNVDFKAFKDLKIPVENTPGVFGREVADLACHYVTALARQTYEIDRKVKRGEWFKPIGQSLWSSRALIVGFGDIGQNLAKRLSAHDMDIWFTDPNVKQADVPNEYTKVTWPHSISHVDYLIFTAPLNQSTFHMLNHETIKLLSNGTKIVNVGRGQLIQQEALINALQQEKVAAAALDVFEVEPFTLETHKSLIKYADRLILGSHNGSNTAEAVEYVSKLCITKLKKFLES